MSDYDLTIRSSLKLKGSSTGGIKKKSKKKKKERERERMAEALKQASIDSGETYQQEHDDGKTPAERRFEEVQRKREEERIKKAAAKSHKEKVAEFNEYLGNLSEHYDIPKVGPG
ncbi:hypothetical protein SYNPS1DRAFT_27499 [Syncephalis pseudoplumigaleata]|uniref:DUF1754-domain-containing protein n=1 Tax=Syncephalis pseudoplumigaleata TaxID=1712513 RepID=A0A4P9Z445_9FUNG|nr:hypothetical protein SYNPS1DRAFT_27499 [Syncephalis pseudoplumigaleata]|eukprot:RKP26822.1 hypothetical protein SYNPS1DRAFT_27499 [Syncephalis pseudoplumigaleata]